MRVATYLKISAVVAVATIALKTAAWWVTDSVSLLSDAMESVVNLAGALFALAMVTVATRPADADHPYGHHKAEYFSSGFEGLLILLAGVGIVWAAAQRIQSPQAVEHLGLGLALNVASTMLNAAMAAAMIKKARAERSIALEADAKHLMADVWTSTGVVLGLLAAKATGWWWLDPVIAIAVAINIAREGYSLLRRSSDGLMDKALEPEVQEVIDRVLQGFAQPRLIRFDHVSTRRAGQRRFVDLHMHVPPDWSMRRAAALRGP
jgi:cation diffusion facilitator family transporter